MINSMLITSGLTKYWWDEAFLTSCTILNMISQKGKDLTPYEMWHKIKPNLKTLKVWSCLTKVGVPDNKKRELDPKTVHGIFLGYANNQYVYRFLIIKYDISEIPTNVIVEQREATFFENIFPIKEKSNQLISIDSSVSSIKRSKT